MGWLLCLNCIWSVSKKLFSFGQMCGLSLFLNLRSGGDSTIEKTALCSSPVLLAAGNEDLWGVPETVWWKPCNAENGSSVLLPSLPILFFSFSSSPFSPFLACLLLSHSSVLVSLKFLILPSGQSWFIIFFFPFLPPFLLSTNLHSWLDGSVYVGGFCSQMLLWEVSTAWEISTHCAGEGKQEGRRALDSLGEPTEGPASRREKEKAVGVELGYHTYRIRRDLTNKSQDDDPEGSL